MNLLSTETSPYLRQHENNPVHWMPWGETAFAKAAQENKPILLSIGYAACHWCHVMAHESFEDKHIAAFLNEHFVAIKVDREERPDIDAIYQQSLALMGKQGGWPLTLFLTPEGKTFWGGTYFPPIAMQGLPSFGEVLLGINNAWKTERDKIEFNTNTLHDALEKLQSTTSGPEAVARQWHDQIADALHARMDKVHGGFGTAPKFPQWPALSFLWDYHIHSGRADLKSAVIQTATSLCQGGIFDHIGGGIARYTVDQEWLVPHFEKMLSDNAFFIGILSELYRETQNPLFRHRVAQTVGFLKREMMVEYVGHSAFASSLDADSDGIEGAHYIWTTDEVEKLLDGQAASFMESYDITRFGNWHEGGDGVSIPNRLQSPNWLGDEIEETLAEQADLLLAGRLNRPLPARDDKVLADWNGMMIAQLARAGFAFADDDYIDLARHAYTFIKKFMVRGDHHLYHSFCEEKASIKGMLDDYTAMGLAALELYQTSFDPRYLDDAKGWANILLAEFYDEESGLFFISDNSQSQLPLRQKPVDDGPTPSGNGMAALFFAKLAALTGETFHASRARRIVAAVSGGLARDYFTKCSLLSASLHIEHGLQVKVPEKFENVLRTVSLPLSCRLPALTDIAEICTPRHCLPPVSDAIGLAEALREERMRKVLISANDE